MLDRNDLDELTQKRLKELLSRSPEELTDGEVAFLWGRKGYLTEKETSHLDKRFAEYEAGVNEPKEEATQADQPNEPVEKPLNEYTRKELETMATELGIKDVEKFANKDSLIEEIKKQS